MEFGAGLMFTSLPFNYAEIRDGGGGVDQSYKCVINYPRTW